MAGPELVVRVAATLDQLRANLADGTNQIETTKSALQRMASSYDGSKIIAQAGATFQAIEQIGGVTKLTADEQAKANTVLEAAIEKYRALGKDVPPQMQAMADATKQVHKEHIDLLGTIGDVAAAFGIAFTVERLVEWQGQIIENAKQLRNLSLQTNINVEDLQVLSAATKEYGVEGDQLGRALFNLQQRIAGGDQSVVTAYALMGISIDQIKDKNAFDLFMTTERGLGTLSGAIQDTAAKDLYGGKLGLSLIAFSKGADDAVNKARALNTIASGESVRAMAEYADAIERAKTSLGAFFTEIEGHAAQGLNVLTDAADKGASKWSIAKAVIGDFGAALMGTGTSGGQLATLLDHLNQTTEANTKATTSAAGAHRAAAVALDAHGQAAQFMATIELNAAKPLLEWQAQYLQHLKDIGLLDAQHAAAIGVNADQFKKYEAGLQAAKTAAEALAKAEADADAIAMMAYEKRIRSLETQIQATLKAYSFEGQIAQLRALSAAEDDLARHVYDQLTSEKDRAKVIEEMTARHIAEKQQETALNLKEQALSVAGVLEATAAQTAYNKSLGLNAAGFVDVNTALDAHTQRLRDIAAMHTTVEAKTTLTTLANLNYTRSLQQTAIAEDAAIAKINAEREALEAKTRAIQDAAAAAYKAAQDLGGKNVLVPSSASLDAAGIIASTQSVSGFMASVARREGGGPVAAGSPYVVGERGPEMFVPGSNGTILPHGAGGITIMPGAIVFNNAILNDPAGKRAIVAILNEAMGGRLSATGLRMSGA